MFALREIPGKGRGIVAVGMIPMGTRIISEEPIIIVPKDAPDTPAVRASIQEQVDIFTRQQLEYFLSLHNSHASDEASEYLGIIRTNALPFGAHPGLEGVFPTVCRVNHACDNNAHKSWNAERRRYTVHARRDILMGEEITVSYLDVISSRKARRDALYSKHGFVCLCHLCALPDDLSEAIDGMLAEILKLDSLLDRDNMMAMLTGPLQKLRYIDTQVMLYNQLGLHNNDVPRAYLDAANISIANGDLARARIFLDQALVAWTSLEGEDGSNVLRYKAFARNPSKHELYWMSTRWKTTVDEIPLGLNNREFEDWLWRRKKPKRIRQPIDLRDRATFPSFAGLPEEDYVDLEFYTSVDELIYEPRRYWVFLGEIIEFTTLVRLHMSLKDVDGKLVPLTFRTKDRGKELDSSLIKQGYTVAILYAENHGLKYCESGIILEEFTHIKIFPQPLDKLLMLSDRIQKFSISQDRRRTCYACGTQAAFLHDCAECSFFAYCNRDCEIAGWKDKGHKEDCEILQDDDLRGLLYQDWEIFT